MGPVEMSKQVGGTASSREPLILRGGSHITTHVQGRLRRRCNRGLSFNPDPNLCNVTRQFVCSFKNLPYLWNPPLSSLSLFLSLHLLGPGPLLLSCTSISALSSKGREGKARRGKEENIYIEKLARTMAQPTNTADLNQHPQQQQWAQPHQYQQQWMSMQYPATAMAMMQQQMMMYPQHYVPYVHHHYQPPHQQLKQQTPPPPPPQPQHNHLHHQQQQQNQGSPDEIRTIWLGDLHHWMDENYLHNCFAYTGEVLSAKVIRNKQTGQSEGYGFVEFYSRATAEKVLQNYNGTMMPNTDQAFRLNWATFSAGDRRSDVSSDLSIFVGDLAIDVTDAMLQETFASRYSSVKGAKVVIDSNTGRSKGYGFVRFGDENERSRAISEMNGIYCSSRPMRIGVATPKKTYGYQQQYSSQAVVLAGGGHSSNGAMAQGSQSEGDFNNTTIFVGGLDSDISDEDLRQSFLQFGEVVSVKIPVGKGCGFVQFADRKNAEEAIQALNGTVIGKQTVRLSWGRSPGNKHWRTDSNGSHYGGQGYGGHGFAVRQNQDIAMHPAATIQGAS